jgi:predicted nucleotidyltransferase
MDYNRIYQLIEELNKQGVEYIVVGGIALALHGVVRATEDIDLFIEPTGENIARLKNTLRSLWNDSAIEEISAEDLLGDYPAVRYGPPDDSISIDILTRLGEAFRYEDLEAESIRTQDITARVATVKTLIRMKEDTVRFQDKADVKALLNRFGGEVA